MTKKKKKKNQKQKKKKKKTKKNKKVNRNGNITVLLRRNDNPYIANGGTDGDGAADDDYDAETGKCTFTWFHVCLSQNNSEGDLIRKASSLKTYEQTGGKEKQIVQS